MNKLQSLLDVEFTSDGFKENVKGLFFLYQGRPERVEPIVIDKDVLEILLEIITDHEPYNILLHTRAGKDIISQKEILRTSQALSFLEKFYDDAFLKDALKKSILENLFDPPENSQNLTLKEVVSLSINSPYEGESCKYVLKKFIETNDLLYIIMSLLNIRQIKKLNKNITKIFIPYEKDLKIFIKKVLK